jgi:hypothetical protein
MAAPTRDREPTVRFDYLFLVEGGIGRGSGGSRRTEGTSGGRDDLEHARERVAKSHGYVGRDGERSADEEVSAAAEAVFVEGLFLTRSRGMPGHRVVRECARFGGLDERGGKSHELLRAHFGREQIDGGECEKEQRDAAPERARTPSKLVKSHSHRAETVARAPRARRFGDAHSPPSARFTMV